MAFTPKLGKVVTDTSTSSDFTPKLGRVIADQAQEKPEPVDRKKSVFQRIADTAKTASMYLASPAAAYAVTHPKETAETAVGMVKQTAKAAIQLPRAAVAGAAGLIGAEDVEAAASKPIQVPLVGEVKGLSAVPGDVEKYGTQTAGETALQAGSMYLEAGAPGAAKVLTKAGKAIRSAIGMPTLEAAGEIMSATPKHILEKASTPEIAKAVKEVRDLGISGSPEDVVALGEEAYSTARKTQKAAMSEYQASRNAIIGQKQNNVIQRSRDFVDSVGDVLKANKIKTTEDGLNLVGSQFEGSASAKQYLDRVNTIMTRPLVKGSEAVDDLLTRREALSSVLDEIPKNEKNLQRVIKDMRNAFDTTLETVLGTEATALRESYRKAIQPSSTIIKAMTTEGKFSPDKARAFMDQAMSTVKFDKRAVLSDLDAVAGTGFAKTVEAVGIDNAINQLTPRTSSRVVDVVKTYAIAKLPAIGAFFTPKFWGELALAKGLRGDKAIKEGAKQAKQFGKWFVKNIMTMPLRNKMTE